MSLTTAVANFQSRPSSWSIYFRWPQKRSEVVQTRNYTVNKYGFKERLQCAASSNLRTCRNCKTQFDPLLNHARACRFHTAHFGGETRRKFESVYTGGTMDTPDSGKVLEYWHCCGSEDPFNPGCTAAPHSSYDDD